MVATKYDKSFNELAKTVAKVMGATDKQLAEIIGIGESTLYDWKIRHPEFAEAVRAGKDEFDKDRVEGALLQRALGYEHEETKLFSHEGVVTDERTVIRHYPPDTNAGQFWLKNRDRSRWRDKQEVEHTGPDGGPIQYADMTDDQLETFIKALAAKDG